MAEPPMNPQFNPNQPHMYPSLSNPHQVYPYQPQDYPNQPQGYPNQPQGYPNQPQGYPNQPPMMMASIPGCPPGLEPLAQATVLHVEQSKDWIEVLCPACEQQNKYFVKDAYGRHIFTAKEESNVCLRLCCGTSRPFEIHVTDIFDRDVIQVNRPLRCSHPCPPCCLQKMEVFSNGVELGTVKEAWRCITPEFYIKDKQGNNILIIKAPCCGCKICPCMDWEFTVFNTSYEKVGEIVKKYAGAFTEFLTDADLFTVSFPIDLDIGVKATIMCAVFLIDFLFFEDNSGKDNLADAVE